MSVVLCLSVGNPIFPRLRPFPTGLASVLPRAAPYRDRLLRPPRVPFLLPNTVYLFCISAVLEHGIPLSQSIFFAVLRRMTIPLHHLFPQTARLCPPYSALGRYCSLEKKRVSLLHFFRLKTAGYPPKSLSAISTATRRISRSLRMWLPSWPAPISKASLPLASFSFFLLPRSFLTETGDHSLATYIWWAYRGISVRYRS